MFNILFHYIPKASDGGRWKLTITIQLRTHKIFGLIMMYNLRNFCIGSSIISKLCGKLYILVRQIIYPLSVVFEKEITCTKAQLHCKHSMATSNLKKSVWLVTITAAASKYIPRRPRISNNWNPPFQTFFTKFFLCLTIHKKTEQKLFLGKNFFVPEKIFC